MCSVDGRPVAPVRRRPCALLFGDGSGPSRNTALPRRPILSLRLGSAAAVRTRFPHGGWTRWRSGRKFMAYPRPTRPCAQSEEVGGRLRGRGARRSAKGARETSAGSRLACRSCPVLPPCRPRLALGWGWGRASRRESGPGRAGPYGGCTVLRARAGGGRRGRRTVGGTGPGSGRGGVRGLGTGEGASIVKTSRASEDVPKQAWRLRARVGGSSRRQT